MPTSWSILPERPWTVTRVAGERDPRDSGGEPSQAAGSHTSLSGDTATETLAGRVPHESTAPFPRLEASVTIDPT